MWTRSRVEESNIALDDVFDEALRLVSTAAEKPQQNQRQIAPNQNYGEEDLERVTLGIVTALPKEFAAMKRVLGNGNEVVRRGTGSGRRYWIAAVQSSDGRVHIVAVVQLVSMGNNISTARATQFFEHCPSVRVLLMVGIAGGIPNPTKADEHVRLGDIVISNLMGVIQYDLVKRTSSFEQLRHPPRPPSPELLEAINSLEGTELEGVRPWEAYIAQAVASLGWTRPPLETDSLLAARGKKRLAHPHDDERRPYQPKVFRAPIASANKLLKDPELRDSLRDQFGVKAVEMEGSGVADASWLQERGYFVVRGVCDYCDKTKGDVWQKYAAIVAAAYARSILEHLPAGSAFGQSVYRDGSQRDAERLRDLVHQIDTRRVFYELEENIEYAVKSIREAREEMRGISRGLWEDKEAEDWAGRLQRSLSDFLTDVDKIKPGARRYQTFYKRLETLRRSVVQVVIRMAGKYPKYIRPQNL